MGSPVPLTKCPGLPVELGDHDDRPGEPRESQGLFKLEAFIPAAAIDLGEPSAVESLARAKSSMASAALQVRGRTDPVARSRLARKRPAWPSGLSLNRPDMREDHYLSAECGGNSLFPPPLRQVLPQS